MFVCFEEKDDAEFVLVVEHLTRREISLGKGRIHPVIEEEESDDEKAFI